MLNTSTVKINTILNLFFLTTMVFFNFALGQEKAEHNKEAKFVNRLEKESSPYLLQHKNNPVDWYPWSEEAFKKAKELDIPIFLSIGYSTCHWCHVMEKESFEDEEVAKLLNDNFISIKVDKEERPEIDHIYMTVCQAMTGRGGWPLTIIMSPDKQPFFAGTYFPKRGRFGRPGMMELIPSISEAWKTKRNELIESANKIEKFLIESNKKTIGNNLNESILDDTYSVFVERYDNENGGFGSQPKFPSPQNIIFLLRYHKMTGNKTALEMAEKTLINMRMGGIYDQLGFGFHRYSTDKEWLVPHFEKMLYDQAMLSIAYTEAYHLTKKDVYKKIAIEILTYIKRDLTDQRGGFYSAEDADSEGEEGTFYIWSLEELNFLEKSEKDLSIEYFNLEDEGNYLDESTRKKNGKNIFHIKSLNNISDNRYEKIRTKLFEQRKKRIHPLKDDKILTDWNGLAIAAFAKAGDVFDNEEFVLIAEKSADFISRNLKNEDGTLLKRYRNGKSGINGHLDDYAFYIWGLLELYESTFKVDYLEEAIELSDIVIKNFSNENNAGFYLSGKNSEKMIVRSITGYDGAIPSGNSIIAMNLVRLSKMTGEIKWIDIAENLFKTFSNEIQRSPSSFSSMLSAYLFEMDSPKEIVIVGELNTETKSLIKKIKKNYNPSKVLIFKNINDTKRKLSKIASWTNTQYMIDEKPTFYVCKDFACKIPTNDIDQALKFVNE